MVLSTQWRGNTRRTASASGEHCRVSSAIPHVPTTIPRAMKGLSALQIGTEPREHFTLLLTSFPFVGKADRSQISISLPHSHISQPASVKKRCNCTRKRLPDEPRFKFQPTNCLLIRVARAVAARTEAESTVVLARSRKAQSLTCAFNSVEFARPGIEVWRALR